MKLVQSTFTEYRLALAGTARAPLSQIGLRNCKPGLAAMHIKIRKYLKSDRKGFVL